MKDEGIAVVLTYTADSIARAHEDALESKKGAEETRESLDQLSARLERVASESGTDVSSQRTVVGGTPRVAPIGRPHDWGALVADAQRNLREQGIDTQQIDLDGLLDPEEVKRLNRRHEGGFRIEADLDPYDIIVAVAAGLTAAVVDALVVRIPADTKWYGDGKTLDGSPLTKALRELSIDSDNWLGAWAEVAYDRVSGPQQQALRMGPRTHRVQTFGHDPLLGLVFGTLDIMRGQMTAVAPGGGVKIFDTADPVTNIFIAFATQIAHLLSDVPTNSGLPLPGWVALANIKSGKFGPNGESLGGIARRMYVNGYDSWHLLTMMTSVASLEVVLRGYWGLRASLDPEWHASVQFEAQRAGSTGASDHPRYAAMALAANAVAAAGNLGKIAFGGGNPLALNYAQWLAFLRAFYTWADGRMVSPSEVVDAQVRANAMAAAAGWEGLDFGDPAFPSPPLA